MSDNNYQIIYVNGPSSAGKTTLARAIQNSLSSPFLLVGIDQLIDMMPKKMNDWSQETEALGFSWLPVLDEKKNIIAYRVHTGSFGKRVVQAFRDIVITLAQSGHNIIIDDVSFGKEQVDIWRNILKDYDVLWLGVTAPTEVLEQREKERGDRKIGSACWQTEQVHKGVCYNFMIDTYDKCISENVKIVKLAIES